MTLEDKFEKIITDNGLKLSKKAQFVLLAVFKMQANEALDNVVNILINKRNNLPEFIDTPQGKKSTAEQYQILDEIINLVQRQKE